MLKSIYTRAFQIGRFLVFVCYLTKDVRFMKGFVDEATKCLSERLADHYVIFDKELSTESNGSQHSQ